MLRSTLPLESKMRISPGAKTCTVLRVIDCLIFLQTQAQPRALGKLSIHVRSRPRINSGLSFVDERRLRAQFTRD